MRRAQDLLGDYFSAALRSDCTAEEPTPNLADVKGVTRVFDGPFFHEAVIRLPKDATAVLATLADAGILGGYHLGRDFPALKDCVLLCATETRTDADIEKYRAALAAALA